MQKEKKNIIKKKEFYMEFLEQMKNKLSGFSDEK